MSEQPPGPSVSQGSERTQDVVERREPLRSEYLEAMRTHVDEGGTLSHRNGVDLLSEVERLNRAPVAVSAEWQELVEDLLDYIGPDCRIDHNGNCQEHGVAPAHECLGRRLKDSLARMQFGDARWKSALERIAAEQKVYTGHGNYDIIPECSADEAQKIARRALSLPVNEIAAHHGVAEGLAQHNATQPVSPSKLSPVNAGNTSSDGGVERRHAVDDGEAPRLTRDAKAVMEAGVAPSPSETLRTARDCIADLGSGKGGWAWEEVLQEIDALLEGPSETLSLSGLDYPPDWKQDQAETSRLFRRPSPARVVDREAMLDAIKAIITNPHKKVGVMIQEIEALLDNGGGTRTQEGGAK